jgi:hypothetical protein
VVYGHGQGVKLRSKEEHWGDVLVFKIIFIPQNNESGKNPVLIKHNLNDIKLIP